ncbi:MAG: hypothetical protein RL700_514, partial [Pseudomonadota bacterium]
KQLLQLCTHRRFQSQRRGTWKQLCVKRLSQPDHRITGGGVPLAVRSQGVNLALDGVACHGALGPSLGNHGTDTVVRGRRFNVQRKMRRAGINTCTHDRVKICFLGNADHTHAHSMLRPRRWTAQTANRLRPLARLALITARPPRVFMRTKKPWVRARRVLEGW